MASEQEKRQLVLRRTSLLASLGRASKFLEMYEDEKDRLEVALRIENLDVVRAELENIQTSLECNDETSEVSSCLKSLKLPTITLPEFDGNYNEWLAFHDTFFALIHSNQDVPDIQKFHHLKSSVTGEAAQVIESFAISAANYQLAWQALVGRYANEYLLKKRHIQAMLEIPRIKKETTVSLHKIVDDFERHTKILRQLGEPVEAWSTMLEHLLCIPLPDETLKAWEDHAASSNNQTYDALIEFLHRRIRVLESVSVNHAQSPQQYVPSSHSSAPLKTFQIESSASTVIDGYPNRCYACEQRHPLVKCTQFGKMSAADRLTLVSGNRLCLNCFRGDHFSRNCPSKYTCRFCKRRHHSLLHSGFGDNTSASGSNNVSRITTNLNLVSESDESTSSILSAATSIKQPEVECSLPVKNVEKNAFLLTAVVVVVDRYGKEHYARALLDSASQPNLKYGSTATNKEK
ncbi:uncharacterized protein LOC129773986 [Toxorhynchites rutilus septentrionalis]|uniref:uncharacterized protein LOC129773986 n=1 Tax=Toxorhynchites rutilus septentrionalis TaxID=329112 RepID=UPI00247999E8|nr:uncharacterized protein LOC129773986 [Toxorhynchites rutilus septentrionalis]